MIVATPYAPNQTGNYSLTLNRGGAAAAFATEAINPEAVAPRRRTVGSVGVESMRGQSNSQFERFAARRVIERR